MPHKPPPPPQPLSLLVVDDDGPFRGLLARALGALGLACEEAADGDQAVERMQEGPLDVVIVDVVMPVRDGLSTLVEIKARWPDACVVAMSGGGRIGPDDFLQVAARLGADATIAKPFTRSQLIELLPLSADRARKAA